MIHIDFDPKSLTGDKAVWWDAWLKKAQTATDLARKDFAAKREHEFREQVWKELKDWLLHNVYEGKCAYCETTVEAGFYGDADHYRPKGAVTRRRKPVLIAGKPHPGYSWLAYDWPNLLPSCKRCNSGAKGSEFEVAKRYRVDPYLDSIKLDVYEEPLLLHPYGNVDPLDVLEFSELGGVAARDGNQRADETIRICGLDREELSVWRQRVLEDAWKEYARLMAAQQINQFFAWARVRQYTGAVIQHVERKWAELKPQLRAKSNVVVNARVQPSAVSPRDAHRIGARRSKKKASASTGRKSKP